LQVYQEVKPFETKQLQTLNYNRKVSEFNPRMKDDIKNSNSNYSKLNEIIENLRNDIDRMSQHLIDYSYTSDLIKKEFMDSNLK
jgi:hypothetical protein